MSTLELYLLTRLDMLHDVCGILALVMGISLGIVFTMWPVVTDEDTTGIPKDRVLAYVKRVAIGAVMFLLLSCFIPTNKQLALIIAGNWATNSEEMTELPDNVAKTLNKFMTDYVETSENK